MGDSMLKKICGGIGKRIVAYSLAGAFVLGTYYGGAGIFDQKTQRRVDAYVKGEVHAGIEWYEGGKQELTQSIDDWVYAHAQKHIKRYAKEERLAQRIDQFVDEEIAAYQLNDRNWTKKQLQKRKMKIPRDQRRETDNSTYLFMNELVGRYEGDPEDMVTTLPRSGSGILLKGGYFLTARHCVEPPQDNWDFWRGRFITEGKNMYMATGSAQRIEPDFSSSNQDPKKKGDLETLLLGSDEMKDYALLKITGNIKDLPFYSKGLNLPQNVEKNMTSLVLGHINQFKKNSRSGEVTQLDSDRGEDYLTFKNFVDRGDSGGPMFEVFLNHLECCYSAKVYCS